ncbi:hypothetical protein H9P43_009464 [Blastocladiella emersonii ATCC 22665]|nr:hypothetical protein H9P43_009464 [Blastocladiella emersonii ATCC 22665]
MSYPLRDTTEVTKEGLCQFEDNFDVHPDLWSFVNRILKSYTKESKWVHAFAPLDHVNKRVDYASWGPFAHYAFAKALGAYLKTGVMPGNPELLQANVTVLANILIARIVTVLRRHKLLRGATQLAAARAKSKVVDAVVHVVAQRACAVGEFGNEPVNGIWGLFMNPIPMMYEVPHRLLTHALRRIKLLAAFIDLVLKRMVAVFDREAAKSETGVPIFELAKDVMWPIFYDVVLVHGSKGLWVMGKTMLVSGPLFCGFEGAANNNHFTMSSSVAFFITEMRSVATATAPPPSQGPNGPPMFTAGPLLPAKMVPGAAAAPAALVPLMAACTTRSPTSTSASVNAPLGGTTSGSTTSGSATTPLGPVASAVVQELDINLQEWDDVGSESDMTVVPALSSAVTKNKNITKIVVDLEANEEVNANEEESKCESGPSLLSSRARKMATKAKGRDKNKTVKTPPASPTKRTRTSAVKGKSGAAVPAAQDDDKADDDDSATPPASPTKRARRGPAKGKGKDRSA